MSRSNAHVKWAQRADALLITIEVVDARDVKPQFTDRTIRLTGTGICKVGAEASPFEVVLNLDGALADGGHSFKVLGQVVQVRAAKAANGHWDRLTSESSKALRNWLSCDWSLWKDEDEVDANERLDFGGGGYGDLGNMLNAASAPDDDEPDERPPADLSDLGV